jgi:hypothetical protein
MTDNNAVQRDQERILNEYYRVVVDDHKFAEEALRRIVAHAHNDDVVGFDLARDRFEEETCMDFDRLSSKADLF